MSFCNTFGIKANDKEMVINQAIRDYFTKDLRDYDIPEGVTDIRSYCFFNFWPQGGLKVTLPNTIKRIAPYAFSECALSSIRIPASCEEICDYAFYGTPLTTLIIENGCKRIGNAAFKYGPKLKYVIIPDSVEYIGEEAFCGMDVYGGAIVEIGEGIRYIGNSAFASNIESMVIHRKYGALTDGSAGYFDGSGNWHDAVWYEGFPNPMAIWDGDY